MGGKAERAHQILRQTFHDDGDRMGVRTFQDVEPHLNYAAALRREDAENRGRFGKRRDFHRGMTVPFNVIAMAAAKLGIAPGKVFSDRDASKRIWKELHGPDYKHFRTSNDKRL